MKLSLSWLKNYVSIDMSVDDLVKRLTMAGMEIEHVERQDDNAVLDIEITPNRPDCLSMWGLAREVAAVTGQEADLPRVKALIPPMHRADVSIEDKDACRRYIGIVIRDVHVKHPDAKISHKLESVGMRSISNIVDITNFLLMETGQPMHAFDLDKLAGGKIVVRRARAGETIVTLDGEERKLDPSILVIADAEKPVAIAGIKGGQSAEVTWETKNILLESAYFDPVLVRRTSRKLKLSTDSSYRFERGVDPAMVEVAVHRAAEMVIQMAGGKLHAYRDVQTSARFGQAKTIVIQIANIERRLGCSLTSSQVKTFLKALGCAVKVVKKGSLSVDIPTFRNDLQQEVDFDEEIARLIGYDRLPSTLPAVPLVNIGADPAVVRKRAIRSRCLAQGLDEIVTFSTMPEDVLAKTRIPVGPALLQIVNPLSSEQKIMRPSALPSFLQTVCVNFNNGQKHLRLFEMGKVYGQKQERGTLSVLLTGTSEMDWRQGRKAPYHFYDLKGIVETIIQPSLSAEIVCEKIVAQVPFMDAQQSAMIRVGQDVIGFWGRVSSDVLKAWDIKAKDIWYAEVDLDVLCRPSPSRTYFQALPEYPAIVRDLTVLVKNDTTLQSLRDDIARQKIALLQQPVMFKDEYRGEGVPAGQRALTLSLVYQAPDRTLTDEEVDAVHRRIIQSLADHLGAVQK